MKKSLSFLLIAATGIIASVMTSFAASAVHVDKSQVQEFAGKTAVVTADTQLVKPYTLTYSDGSTYNDVLFPMASNDIPGLSKGDIVIVMDEADSNTYRVRVIVTGDGGIINGVLNKKLVSFDKTAISNANQCTYQSGIVGYESQTNEKVTLPGATSPIFQRANGKLLIGRIGGETRRYWVDVKDVSFNFDRTVTDISLAAYKSLVAGTSTPAPTPIPDKPNQIVLKVTMNKLQYTVNGTPMMFDVAPYLDTKADRSMIPMRFIAEAFGAAVTWDDSTKTQIIKLNGKTFKLTQNVALPDGMGTPVLVKDRFFVPLRYVSQELGASVDWDNATQTNTIVYYK